MADYRTISKQSPSFPAYLDFELLRGIGLDHLQQLASDLWTDYNLHDPGVTILEVLCYAITDLGYRNNLEIQNLLALNPADPNRQENNFFTPNQILTCNPVTILDWRQRLIDIPGVRNAWIEPVTEVGDPISVAEVEDLLNRTGDEAQIHLVRPAFYANCTTEALQFGYPDLPEHRYHRLNPRGLYDVCLDLEPEPHKDACGVVHRSRGKILEAVRSVLCHYRNLCEDFRDIIVLGEEEIAVCADIELTAAADPEDVLVAVYVAVQAFLAPRARFYTLQEMLARGKATADIFAGRPAATLDDPATAAPNSDCLGASDDSALAYLSHGFIDVDELEALTLPTEIHASDLYRVIMGVPGVAAIKKLNLINYINGLRQSEGHPWCLKLTDKHRPVLGVDQSTITFFKGDLPFKVDSADVKQRYQEQQAAYIKTQKEPSELDLPVPRGTYFDLADHYSIHHDFPLTYGIGEDGLPAAVSAQRKAQAKQLKGYLIFFDQLLANYLAQLSHVRDLFAWDGESDRAPTATQPDRRRTYFTQGLTNVPCAEDILKNFHRCSGSDLPGAPPIDYTAYLDFITESPETYYARRHQFLDHLLGRFAETFTDYVLLNYRLSDGRRRPESDILDDKAQFLKDYPVLGRDRFRAFNYCRCGDVWDSDNVSGFKKRVSRLLGMDDFSRRHLSSYRVVAAPGGYQLVLQKAAPGDDDDAAGYESESEAGAGSTNPAESENRNPAAMRFTSRHFYGTATEAQAALAELKQAALVPDRYRRLVYRSFQGTAETFTDHGYGILDADGQLLAESSDRFATPEERDWQLQRWLTCLLANQNQFRVEPATECFFVELRDRAGEEIWLLGAVGVSSHAAALTQQTLLLETGKDRDAYELTETASGEVTTYSFALRSGDRLLAHHTDTYRAPDRVDQPRYGTAVERDLWLDALLYYLNQPEPTAFVSGEVGTYQATLLDRDRQPLLITYHSYATRNLAEVAYQRLLYLASDPVYFQIVNDLEGGDLEGGDLEGDNPYGFSLIDRRGRIFATHPGRYQTSCERDLAIRNIINYVNQELTLQFPQREGGFYIDLRDQAGRILLAGNLPYASEAAATAAADSLLLLARQVNHYQLLNDGEGDCPYGFALVDGDERLATHPAYYALESERDRALQTVISGAIDDDPIYTIDGVEGQFSYGLVDVLAVEALAPEDSAGPSGPLLLTSAVLYPDADAAQRGFDILVELGADAAQYHWLDDLPAPNVYGFELRDQSGEAIARPLTAAGEAIGYGSAQEREAAIAKILYYLAQPEIQVSITNPEGAFFAELYDQQHELVWSGQRTLPSPAAAAAEAALIRQLSGMPAAADSGDPYPYQIRSGLGSCPQSFDLVMAAESEHSEGLSQPASVLIARHPRFYESEAARDRAIQQLRLRFSENLVDFIETPAVETAAGTRYGFAFPAAYFCAVYDCDAEQQERFATGSLLGPPPASATHSSQPVTYATAAEAGDKFIEALSFAAGLNHFFEIYENGDCLNNPNAQPFRFELKASGDRPAKAEDPTIATSARTYHSRAEMWAVIHFLHQLAQGFTVTVATPGTHCGYYFYLDLPPTTDGEPIALRSLQRYPSATRAWAAAGAFAENVRFLNRYLGSGEVEGTAYGFAIGDETGTPLAIAPAALDPVEVFQGLNNLGNSLVITAGAGEESGYRFQLIEPMIEPMANAEIRVWLQGLTVHPDPASATTQFYRDVLGRLLEPEAIAPYDTPSGFSFRLLLPSADSAAPPTVIALHPQPGTESDYQFYPTPAERDRAIAQLKTFIRTLGVDVQAAPVDPAWVGEVVAADGTVLLRTARPQPALAADADQQQAEAWADSDTLIELAQNRDNIRWVDDEEGSCLFSWELTNRSKDAVLAAPLVQYDSTEEREAAIAALQARLNDEGFHVLEHILLRPQQLLPPPAPCEAPEPAAQGDPPKEAAEGIAEGATEPATEHSPDWAAGLEPLFPIALKQSDCEAATAQNVALCRTSYDPYSFWVSVVLPYWPERFRDMNFRRLVERTLRLEAPAHIALKICWVNAYQMQAFDQAYRNWIEQFALNACEGAACDLPGSLTALINILTRLENVYPQGTLHDCEESDAEDNPIILDQTALGTAEDT